MQSLYNPRNVRRVQVQTDQSDLAMKRKFSGQYLPSVMNTDDDNRNSDDGVGIGISEKVKEKTKKPNLYKVLLLNDDYTPMEFVVHILERFFNKPRQEAEQIMLHVHHRGVGVCGVFTYEVAETKVTQVMLFAKEHQHPLQCTMEKE